MATNSINPPLISVIIPVYNLAEYISQTISSVLAQTYSNVEIIVVDDGSTDRTATIVQEHFAGLNIRLVCQTNQGASAARNVGYRQSTGAFIKFLDGDDLINEGMLQEQLNCAVSNPGCVVSAAWGRFYGPDPATAEICPEECWQTMDAFEWLLRSWKKTASMTNPGLFLIPRQVIERAGLWNEELSLLDDTEYFTRTLLVGPSVIFAANAFLFYRSGRYNNLSGSKTEKSLNSAYQAYAATTNAILSRQADKETQLLCANIWQLFIYNIYPDHPQLMEKAIRHLKKLPPPTLPFPCGGYTRLLKNLAGWKTAVLIKKKLESILNKNGDTI